MADPRQASIVRLDDRRKPEPEEPAAEVAKAMFARLVLAVEREFPGASSDPRSLEELLSLLPE